MSDNENNGIGIRDIIGFFTSLRARIIVGGSITLIMVCVSCVVSYVIPYLIKLWDFILNAISNNSVR